MKIALVIDHFDPSKGGAERYLAGFGAWLAARGHAVTVLSLDGPRSAEPAPFETRRLEGARAPRPLRDVIFRRAASRVLALGEFDASLGVRGTLGTTVYAPHGGVYRAAERAQLESVGSAAARAAKAFVRAASPKHMALRRMDDAAIRSERTRVLVAVSSRVESDLRAALHDAPREIALVRNGVDLVRFRPENRLSFRAPARRRLGLSDRASALLLVAHDFRLKGIDTAVRALARLRGAGRDAVLLVAGRGHRARPERLAARLGLGSDAVRFLGDVRDPETLYAAADVLAHSTFYDPASLVALEAMASGLPLVTTRRDGTSEILVSGAEGEVIDDPADDAALADAAERALGAGRARRYAEAARKRAEAWPWERNFAAMEEILRRGADARAR